MKSEIFAFLRVGPLPYTALELTTFEPVCVSNETESFKAFSLV